MAQVIVGIGSNSEREHHVQAGLDALQASFGKLGVSRVFESEPVGCRHVRRFYNLVATFDSDASVGELQRWCKHLEAANGRDRTRPRLNSVTLDIDLLTVGELTGHIAGIELPRPGIVQHAFVLRPLAELLPDDRHPVSQRRYSDLWADFDSAGQRLWPVDFFWRQRVISRAG